MRNLTLLLILFLLGACSVNPVTGERQLILASPQQELQMGIQAYAPSQQSQGGIYDVDPALNAYVSRVGQKIAAYSDNPLPYEFVVLNNSVPNAWALPGGKIAINRGLLTEMNSEAELAAVLGHEIVHAAARHSAQQMTRGMLSQILVVGAAVATSDSDYGDLAIGGATLGSQAFLARYGRSAELESDEYGMKYMRAAGYDPAGAVQLQETFLRLSEGREPDWLSGLFASHPPSRERVQANIQTAASLAPGGELGVAAYEAAMARTRRLQPAYDLYDEGRKALAEKRYDEATAKAEAALKLFDGEAHFHALRGDVRLVQKNYDWAVTNYTRAIERREGFFYYHLQRGLARNELGQKDAAIIDLERSNALLPTAPAHYVLGTIAEERGDRAAAVEHYRTVASSDRGEYGKAATARLVRLDLKDNPGNYIKHACAADNNGNLIVQVRNDAPLPLRNIEIAVTVGSGAGTGDVMQLVRGPVAPGEISGVNTGLGPYTGGSCPARVTRAEIAE